MSAGYLPPRRAVGAEVVRRVRRLHQTGIASGAATADEARGPVCLLVRVRVRVRVRVMVMVRVRVGVRVRSRGRGRGRGRGRVP